MSKSPHVSFRLRILETVQDMADVENLQRIVWPGSEMDIVPAHLMLTAARHGGLIIGAYQSADSFNSELENANGGDRSGLGENDNQRMLAGFVFGFPGLDELDGDQRLLHCSHMLAVHPAVRGHGIGFALKRAQWQMVRRQGIERIIWTYDPLLSRNANLNIARLGAVCKTYLNDAYGEMRDGINAGLSSDRFQVDWWVGSQRVKTRLSKRPRLQLDLAHYFSAGALILNPSVVSSNGLPQPAQETGFARFGQERAEQPIVLVEIPADFQALKQVDLNLAISWRLHTRTLFSHLFQAGYVVTDFIHLSGAHARSFYVLSDGEATL